MRVLFCIYTLFPPAHKLKSNITTKSYFFARLPTLLMSVLYVTRNTIRNYMLIKVEL